jgi:ADP-heptose:LPS heptosyltransferase
MKLEGFDVVESTKDPLRRIPEGFTGGSVLLCFNGGVGDVLAGIGGVSEALSKSCKVTAAVQSHQVPLMSEVRGVNEVITYSKAKSPDFQAKYDIVVNFSGVMTGTFLDEADQRLPDEDYYKVVGKRAGVDARPSKFSFPHEPCLIEGRQVVSIHPWASNPNRRWITDKWNTLVNQLVVRGYHVQWLGTRGEFGFNAEHVDKLSDGNSDLLWQARRLAQSHFFVGCDSGFAHIAGMLGVSGAVLFTSTQAKNVICQYPSLRGVEVFAKLGAEPSRSLLIDDPVAERAKEEITVSMVLESLGLDTINCTLPKDVTRTDAKKYRVRVIDESSNSRSQFLISCLGEYFEVIIDDLECQATLVISDEIDVGNRRSDVDKRVSVRPDLHVDIVHRVLRELING